MRLLIVYYNFPPVKVPGARRLKHIYEQSKQYFKTAQVITTANRKYFLQDPTLSTDAPLHLIPTYDLRRLRQSFRKGTAAQLSTRQKRTWFYRFFIRLLDSFPFNILVGDGGLVYFLLGYRKGKHLVREQGITHLFSSFRPYSDHLIAYLLKRHFPHLHWTADFRDLHVDPANRNVLFPKLQQRINRAILRRADLVTTVSQGLAQHLDPLHPNVYVLYNGVPEAQAVPVPTPPLPYFTIAYTGSLFKNKRRPDLLLLAVKELIREKALNIKIAYAGRDSDAWKAKMEAYHLLDHWLDHGLIDTRAAHQLQRKAQLNLLLTYTSPTLYGNFTSKFFEYLAARKPILALVNGPTDPELEEVFTEIEPGKIIYPPEKIVSLEPLPELIELKAFLEQLYQQWRIPEKVAPLIPASTIEPFHWDHLFKQLMTRINEH